ncbi:MAG: hypothetical protein ABIR62_09305 [Dokdonella sp.]|uniref:hypothetical protein n=1 Tax=Dokdonella sp. TaxID=2291710 RepID=UPI003264FA42
MFKSIVRATLAASLIVAVAACSKEQPGSVAAVTAPAATSPDASIMRSVQLLKAGDLAGVMQNTLPPADFEKAKADWMKESRDKPITDEDRQKFAETMGKLTAPDAEQTLFTEAEPQLKAFDAQYQTQIPMYVAMGSSWLQGMVQQNKDMSEPEKQQAVAAINALGGWVQKTRFTDPDAIKKIIAITVKAARDVNLKTLDEARALNFDQSMQKARIAFIAVKDALAVYGFQFDKMLDSVKTSVVSSDDKIAKVKVDYMLFDSPLSVETDMVKVADRWYGKHAIERMAEKAAEAAPAAAPAAEPTPAPSKAG